MSGTRAISTTSRRELSSSFFLQGEAPKEIHDIMTETLACFFPGRAKDLSAPCNRDIFCCQGQYIFPEKLQRDKLSYSLIKSQSFSRQEITFLSTELN